MHTQTERPHLLPDPGKTLSTFATTPGVNFPARLAEALVASFSCKLTHINAVLVLSFYHDKPFLLGALGPTDFVYVVLISPQQVKLHYLASTLLPALTEEGDAAARVVRSKLHLLQNCTDCNIAVGDFKALHCTEDLVPLESMHALHLSAVCKAQCCNLIAKATVQLAEATYLYECHVDDLLLQICHADLAAPLHRLPTQRSALQGLNYLLRAISQSELPLALLALTVKMAPDEPLMDHSLTYRVLAAMQQQDSLSIASLNFSLSPHVPLDAFKAFLSIPGSSVTDTLRSSHLILAVEVDGVPDVTFFFRLPLGNLKKFQLPLAALLTTGALPAN